MNQRNIITSGLSVSQEPQAKDISRTLLTLRELLETDRLSLQEEIDAVDKKIAAVDLLLDADAGDRSPKTGIVPLDDVAESLGATLQETGTKDIDAEPVSGAATIKDIKRCGTQREAARVIAEINNGDIDLKSAARVIKAVGLSKGMVGTVVSSLHNWMSHSRDWNYVGPSRFELVAHRKVAPTSTPGPDFSGEDSSELGIAEGDLTAVHAYEVTAA